MTKDKNINVGSTVMLRTNMKHQFDFHQEILANYLIHYDNNSERIYETFNALSNHKLVAREVVVFKGFIYWVVGKVGRKTNSNTLFPETWLDVIPADEDKGIQKGSVVKLIKSTRNVEYHKKHARKILPKYYHLDRLVNMFKKWHADEFYALDKTKMDDGSVYWYVSKDRSKERSLTIFPEEWLMHISAPEVFDEEPVKPEQPTVTHRKYSTYVYEFINRAGQRITVPAPTKDAKKKMELIIRDTWSTPVVDGAALSHLHDAIQHAEGRCWLNDMQHVILQKYKIARYVQYEIDEVVYSDNAVKESYTDMLKELR